MNALNLSAGTVSSGIFSESIAGGVSGFTRGLTEENFSELESIPQRFFELSALRFRMLEAPPPEKSGQTTDFGQEHVEFSTSDRKRFHIRESFVKQSDYYERFSDAFLSRQKISASVSLKFIAGMEKLIADFERTTRELLFVIIINRLKSLGFSKSAERLSFLHNYDVSEEDKDPLSLESAQGFLSFITRFSYLKEPKLGLFSGGTLSVSWKIADNKHLLVEPLDDKNASYAFIGPSSSTYDKKFRQNGRGAISDVVSALESLDVDKWRDE